MTGLLMSLCRLQPDVACPLPLLTLCRLAKQEVFSTVAPLAARGVRGSLWRERNIPRPSHLRPFAGRFAFTRTSLSLVTRRATMSLAAERRRKAKALEEAGAALSVKLVARSTRGQRISELLGDDAEADETFWGQGAWQEEEEGDSEFSSEEGENA